MLNKIPDGLRTLLVLFLFSTAGASVDTAPPQMEQHASIASVDTAIAILSEAESHGLYGFDADLNKLRVLRHQMPRGDSRTQSVSEVTRFAENMLLRFSLDFTIGRREPTDVEVVDFETAIRQALLAGTLVEWYKSHMPAEPAYHRLRSELRILTEKLADSGELPTVGAGPTLRPGDSGERVDTLRGRLGVGGSSSGFPYDHELQAAVSQYQEQHGLEVDGLAGKLTQTHIDVSVASRVQQILINLERWRRDPPTVKGKHVRVNLPSFELSLTDERGQTQHMRVVIGHEETPTPLFKDDIEYLVFSPYWNVPRGIAREELLPSAYRDASYLSRQNFEILDRITQHPVSAIDWDRINAGEFPYRFRQKPGPGNALGSVKFIFPNEDNIYLHDTAAPHLFANSRRAYSHGCVRVEDPQALAKWLLVDQPEWSSDVINEAMARGAPKHVSLSKPVPIIITYFTAVSHDSGIIRYYGDIYALDANHAGVMASYYVPTWGELNSGELVVAVK